MYENSTCGARRSCSTNPTNKDLKVEQEGGLAHLYFRMVTFGMEVFMNAITVTLSDDRLAQLQEMATRFQVSPEELVRVGVEELLAQPDDVFQRVVAAVLKKNAELYRRLA